MTTPPHHRPFLLLLVLLAHVGLGLAREAVPQCAIKPDAQGHVDVYASKPKWTVIPPKAFVGCNSLKTINFGPNIKRIETGEVRRRRAGDDDDGFDDDNVGGYGAGWTGYRYGAFENCYMLTATGLAGSSVIDVGTDAFKGCTALTATGLSGSNVTKLGDGAFAGCTALTTTDLAGSSVTTLGDSMIDDVSDVGLYGGGRGFAFYGSGAFENCISLTATGLAGSIVIDVGTNAFKGCTALTSSGLIDSVVKSIGPGAFAGTSATFNDRVNYTVQSAALAYTQPFDIADADQTDALALFTAFVVLAVLALAIAAVYFAVPATAASYLKAALVAVELEERRTQTGIIGTAAARAVAVVALALIFKSTAESTTTSSITDVMRAGNMTPDTPPCWAAVCRRTAANETSNSDELCACRCALLNQHLAEARLQYDDDDDALSSFPLASYCDPGCTVRDDATERTYDMLDNAVCAEIPHGDPIDTPACGVYTKTDPYVFETKKISPESKVICAKNILTPTFSTTEALGISLGWAEVIYMILLWAIKASSKFNVADSDREKHNDDRYVRSGNKTGGPFVDVDEVGDQAFAGFADPVA